MSTKAIENIFYQYPYVIRRKSQSPEHSNASTTDLLGIRKLNGYEPLYTDCKMRKDLLDLDDVIDHKYLIKDVPSLLIWGASIDRHYKDGIHPVSIAKCLAELRFSGKSWFLHSHIYTKSYLLEQHERNARIKELIPLIESHIDSQGKSSLAMHLPIKSNADEICRDIQKEMEKIVTKIGVNHGNGQ